MSTNLADIEKLEEIAEYFAQEARCQPRSEYVESFRGLETAVRNAIAELRERRCPVPATDIQAALRAHAENCREIGHAIHSPESAQMKWFDTAAMLEQAADEITAAKEAEAMRDPRKRFPELAGSIPLVLFFPTNEEADAFIAVAQMALPNMKPRRL